jgi:RHS repeat-associated protein
LTQEKTTLKVRSAYLYGFNGQEKDNEIKGDGNQLDFKFRAYDPRLGRCFAVDPLTKKYPFYTPYQFAGNTPIEAKELEGLEPSHTARTGDCEGCKDINVGDGDVVSDVQHSTYQMVKTGVSQESFNAFKSSFSQDPGTVTNNPFATYVLVDRDGSNGATPNDHIDIDISGPDNGSVRIKVMTAEGNMIHANFITLEGHPDAGEIDFYALYDPATQTFSFTVTNTTQTNVVGSAVGGALLARFAQQEQWEAVLKNANNMVNGKLTEMSRTTTEYDYDDNAPDKKGEIESTTTEDLMDEVD